MNSLEKYWDEILVISAGAYTFSLLIPVIFAIIYSKYLIPSLKIFLGYCVYFFFINVFEQVLIWMINNYTDIFLPYLNYWKITNTFFLSILYHIPNFLFLSIFYAAISPSKILKVWFFRLGILLACLNSINYFFIEGYHNQGVFNPLSDALFGIFIPFVYLWYSQKYSLRIPLKKNPFVWISIGLLIPNILALFLYFTGDFVYDTDYILYAKFQVVNNIIFIICQIVIAIGFAHSYYAKFIQTSEI